MLLSTSPGFSAFMRAINSPSDPYVSTEIGKRVPASARSQSSRACPCW